MLSLVNIVITMTFKPFFAVRINIQNWLFVCQAVHSVLLHYFQRFSDIKSSFNALACTAGHREMTVMFHHVVTSLSTLMQDWSAELW